MSDLSFILDLLREAMTIRDEEQFRNAIAHIIAYFEELPEITT